MGTFLMSPRGDIIKEFQHVVEIRYVLIFANHKGTTLHAGTNRQSILRVPFPLRGEIRTRGVQRNAGDSRAKLIEPSH